ncbi:MAG: hypothetical protein ACPG4T_10225 [Nannocystaceae bacterium]
MATNSSKTQTVPRAIPNLGLVLTGCAALPLTYGSSESFLDFAWGLLKIAGLGAIPTLLALGSPFLFGGLLAALPFVRKSDGIARWVSTCVVLMQTQLVVVGILAASLQEFVAWLPFAGFVGVTAVAYCWEHIRLASERQNAPSLWVHARWGALLIAGFCLWLRLQTLDGGVSGPAIDVALVTSALMLTRLARKRW